jgi:hypothetical protein
MSSIFCFLSSRLFSKGIDLKLILLLSTLIYLSYIDSFVSLIIDIKVSISEIYFNPIVKYEKSFSDIIY